MTLPVTVSNLSNSVKSVGPFQSSGGNYYIIGRDSSTSSTLRAMKATDPTSSWSSVATVSLGAAINFVSAFQVGDIIHICTTMNAPSAQGYLYRTYDMSSDSSFPSVTDTTIQSNTLDCRDSSNSNRYEQQIVVRASDMIVYAHVARVASMGSSYSRTGYYRRTTGAWAASVAVDGASGTNNVYYPTACLGSSDRAHLIWNLHITTAGQRTLNSSNVLETASTPNSVVTSGIFGVVSYDDSGTQRIVGIGIDTNSIMALYFNSAATPTLNNSGDITSTTSQVCRAMNDGTDVWALWVSLADNDVYVAKSTDDGATWDTPIAAYVGTLNTSLASLNYNIFQRGNDYIIGYLVYDGTNLKYNEYVVRSTVAGAPIFIFGQSGIGQIG